MLQIGAGASQWLLYCTMYALLSQVYGGANPITIQQKYSMAITSHDYVEVCEPATDEFQVDVKHLDSINERRA